MLKLTCVLMTLALHFKRTALALYIYVCASRRWVSVTRSILVSVSGKIHDSWKAMYPCIYSQWSNVAGDEQGPRK